jgi:hypothetical protein
MKRLSIFLSMCLLCFSAMAQITNTTYTPLPQATQTATTVNSLAQSNTSYRGGHFIVTVVTATSGTYTPHIQGYDPASGLWYDILIGSAISAVGTTVLKVYPGIGVVANGSASDVLPLTWRVQLIGASTPSMVISVDAYLEI